MSELYYLVVLCSYDLRFTHNALSSKNGDNKARYIYTHTHTHTRAYVLIPHALVLPLNLPRLPSPPVF